MFTFEVYRESNQQIFCKIHLSVTVFYWIRLQLNQKEEKKKEVKVTKMVIKIEKKKRREISGL